VRGACHAQDDRSGVGRGLVASGIAAAPVAGAHVQAPATEDASAQAGSVRWGPCTDPTLVSFNAQCGVVKVPVDYDRPNADQWLRDRAGPRRIVG
jgi:hypothetical protein